MAKAPMTIDYVINTFRSEFAPIMGKFVVTVLEKDRWDAKEDYIWHPGVYVWYHLKEKRVMKVGRALDNARKRALQHTGDDNTHNETYSMKELAGSDQLALILFSIGDPKDYHWVAAVEIYLENALEPAIKSNRQG